MMTLEKNNIDGVVDGEDGYEFSSEPILHARSPDPTAAVEPTKSETVDYPEPIANKGELHLVVRDQKWLFVYWDKDDASLPISCQNIEIRILSPNGDLLASQRGASAETHWLLPAPASGGSFLAEVGWFAPELGWRLFARSSVAQTAPSEPSKDETAAFGLLPFSLAFDRLNALAEMAELRGTSLPEFVAHIAASTGDEAEVVAPKQEWTPEQRSLLETLLDDLSIERFAGNSSAVERLFRRGLQEISISEEELFSRERWEHLLRLAGGNALEGGS